MANLSAGTNFSEGQSVHRPPLFKGDNYLYWKTRMMLYLKSMDYSIWLIIQNGDRVPEERGVPKLPDVMNETDHLNLQLNAKALNTLFCALDVDVFNKVSACDSAKEAWDKLEVTYEGTNQVKENRICMLTHEYELFSMKANESINDMFSRFTNIKNSLKSLGKAYTNAEMVRKLLRSLPENWDAKVTAIQEAKDLSKLDLDELLGSLLTHEMNMKNRQQNSSKEKSIALKSNLEDDDSIDSNDEEEIAMMARKFRKFFKKKKFTPNFQKNDSTKRDVVTCYGCNKTGHFKSECPNAKGSKEHPPKYERKKALKASTWDDSSDSENDGNEEEVANLCLMANTNEVPSSPSSPLNSKSSQEELEENILQLFEAFNAQKKRTKELRNANKALEEENHYLKNEINELQDKVTLSISSQRELSNDLEDLREESLGPSLKLKEENSNLNSQVKKLTTTLEKFATSTKTLDMLLSNQKCVFSKTGIGYEENEVFLSSFFTQSIHNCKACGRLYQGRHKCPMKRIFIINGKHCTKVWIIKGSKPPSSNHLGPKKTWVPKSKS